MILKFAVLAFAGFIVLSFTSAFAADVADQVIDRARTDCKSLGNGILTTDPFKTVSLADLTGDDRPEEIVDANHFSCTTARTLFCGTAGCELTVIVNEQPFKFLAKAWKVEKDFGGQPVLKLAVHWSACEYKNTCWESWKWNGADFKSLGSKPE